MKPRALDLFCCAGGATKGLQRAGFHVTGVDIKPQPRYCGDAFHQADALTFPLEGYDFIWASPPCQAHTSMKTMHNAKHHADLIPATRERLEKWGGPWVMENVIGAPLGVGIQLCGTSFGLGTGAAELRRHRHFEANFLLMGPPCRHGSEVIGVYGGHARNRKRSGGSRGKQDFYGKAGEALGIDWMTLSELSQAIPPAYSEFIGQQVMQILERAA